MKRISKIIVRINFKQAFSKRFLFLTFLLAFLVGVGWRSWFNPDFDWVLFLTALMLVFFLLGLKYQRLAFGGILLLGLLLGWWRFELGIKPLDQNQIAFYNGQKITWRGTIIGEPDQRLDQTKLTFKAKQIFLDNRWQNISGRVLVKASIYPQYNYGDNLEIKCLLKTPEKIDNFDYQAYLSRYGIESLCSYPKITDLRNNTGQKWYTAILKFKTRSVEIINRQLPEPQAGILTATLLGTKQSIPADWSMVFQRTGTTHIIAISGSHITLIVAIIMAILLAVGLGRHQAFYAALGVLAVFIILIGAPAAALRAGLMGFFVLWALKLGRLQQSGPGLILVADLMLLANPLLLKADAGFQLSCLAVGGLIWLRPLLLPIFKWVPENLGLRESLTMTLAAQISTWPLLAFSLGKVSLVGLIANLVIVPVAAWILITGLAGLTLALLLPFLSSIAFWPAWLGLTYLMKSAAIFSAWRWGFFETPGGMSFWLGISYVLLIGAVSLIYLILKFRPIKNV